VSWVTARRAWLDVHPDRLVCGDWTIPTTTVQTATLYQTRQMFIPVSVLELRTHSETFQFGLNPWVRIAPYLPFVVNTHRVPLKHSWFSVLARLVLLGSLLWLAWRSFS
jgi:hypothetical protein